MAEFEFEHLIESIPDYPKPGVIFKDITPLLGDPDGFAATIKCLADPYRDAGVTKVVGAEARGFMVGAPVARELHAGFVPARKPGKLPREVASEEYALEYGTDSLQVHLDAFGPGDKVLIVDDLIATGGTVVATAQLVEKTGAEVVAFGFILELAFLNPREVVGRDYDQEIFSLIKVD